MKKIWKWIKKHNEFTIVIALIFVIWYAAPPALRLIHPKAGEFGVEVLYIPLIAGIFFLMGLLFIWGYLKLVFPKGFKLLDDLFEDIKEVPQWQKYRIILQLFGCLVALYAVSLLAVTGISFIMT